MVDLSDLADDNDDIAALQVRLDELVQQTVLQARDIASLTTALDTCRTIGAAVGIVMASRRLGEDEAFELLRRSSQSTNTKIRDLAAEVVSTGRAPHPRVSRRRRRS